MAWRRRREKRCPDCRIRCRFLRCKGNEGCLRAYKDKDFLQFGEPVKPDLIFNKILRQNFLFRHIDVPFCSFLRGFMNEFKHAKEIYDNTTIPSELSGRVMAGIRNGKGNSIHFLRQHTFSFHLRDRNAVINAILGFVVIHKGQHPEYSSQNRHICGSPGQGRHGR
mgnify:CR=1 FL=1